MNLSCIFIILNQNTLSNIYCISPVIISNILIYPEKNIIERIFQFHIVHKWLCVNREHNFALLLVLAYRMYPRVPLLSKHTNTHCHLLFKVAKTHVLTTTNSQFRFIVLLFCDKTHNKKLRSKILRHSWRWRQQQRPHDGHRAYQCQLRRRDLVTSIKPLELIQPTDGCSFRIFSIALIVRHNGRSLWHRVRSESYGHLLRRPAC